MQKSFGCKRKIISQDRSETNIDHGSSVKEANLVRQNIQDELWRHLVVDDRGQSMLWWVTIIVRTTQGKIEGNAYNRAK